MTPEQRKIEEEQIRDNFSQLQKKLEDLKNEVESVTDNSEKEKKNEEIQKLEKEAEEIKALIDRLSSLKEEELLALKTRLEDYKAYKQEIMDIRKVTPTTYELLKDSETSKRLLKILSGEKFNNLKDDKWNILGTPEAKLEYIFKKVRNSIVLFMKNKLWDSTKTEYVINNTIAPAFEWSLMEMLRDQWNETNISMLEWIDDISWKGNVFLSGFNKLLSWVSNFAKTATWSYNKFSQWMNAVDYLSVHIWVLQEPNKSEVLTNPLKFQEYMNDIRFAAPWFSPYTTISDNIFKIDENQTFDFGISMKDENNQSSWWESDEEKILEKIWNIQVVDNPRTTSLIVKMLDKPEQFLQKTGNLQKSANSLLNSLNALNPVTKLFWKDIMWDISKSLEKKWILFKIFDFVCKLIWITWWVEWIVKKWRLDRMNLTDQKSRDISKIFKEYKESAWENTKVTITDEASCKTALEDFAVTDNQASSTKWDYLRDSIVDNMDISLVSPAVVQQILWTSYVKKEVIQEKWEKKERFVVDESKITESDKYKLARGHLINMKAYLETYKDESNNIDLTNFYKNINSTEDIALCITASLYADKDDVVEWVKAKVFLPENYGAVRSDWTVDSTPWKEKLDAWIDASDKQKVSEQRVYDKSVEYGITDKRQIAYVLSTIKWESWFKNIEEDWKWSWKDYGTVDRDTNQAYYGRGFIQLTGKGNYQKFTEIIKKEKKNFKDNEDKELKFEDIDLVKNPDLILKSNELSIFIAMYWMKNGTFTWKKLDDFINETNIDFYNARSIVNWMSSKPQEYANNAQSYLNTLNQIA